jgi:iron complex outermembrane receptor protein
MIKHISLIISLLLGLSAQAQMIFDTLNLEEMVIKSNFIERNSTRKSQQLDTLVKQDLNHLNLGELLRAESPIFVKSYGKGSLSTAAFRGTAASHTKVLWNDFEINSPMLGQVDLSLVPNLFFDQAQLDYGGSSIESTSGAFGGAINLYSGNNTGSNKVDFVQGFGSFNTFTSSLKVNLKIKQFTSGTSVYLNSSENSFSYYNNAILPPDWQKQQNASYYNRGFLQEFDCSISEHHSIKVQSWNQWNFREIPLIMSNTEVGNNEEHQHDFSSRNIVSYKYKNSKTTVETKAAWFYDDLIYLLKTSTAINHEDTVTFINSTNKSSSGFFKTKLNRNLNNGWMISVELSANLFSVNSNNYKGIKSRENYGLFLKLNKKFSETIVMDLLLRQQYSEDRFLPVMPFLGLSIKPLKQEEIYIRASVNLNYNLPSLNDLYWYPGGNPELLPEEGMQFDIGLNYAKSFSEALDLRFDISFYDSRISNWIQWIPSDYRYWTARNVEKVHARGLESSISLSGNKKNFFYKFSMQYSFNKSTNESRKAKNAGYAGRQLIYVPLHSANFFFYLKYKQNNFIWNTQLIGKRNTSLDEETLYSNTLPAYSLSSMSIGRQLGFRKFGLELRIKVNNIFNVSYQAILWRPMPGRSFEVFLGINM